MVGAMLETNLFFQKQIERCNLLAEEASNQSEQEFWLGSAHRWEEILRLKSAKRSISKPSDSSGEVPSGLQSGDDQGSAPLP
jgi:hypothetical protein